MVTLKAFKAYMSRNGLFSALSILGAAVVVSCNSSTGYETEPVDYSGVTLTGFSLQANSDVLNNLDSVFFSIDLANSEVFNADSLPMSTDVSALAITLSYDACSQAMLYESPGEDGTENEINYLEDSDSKINFANGPVRLHLVSADGLNSRDYTLRVNVHKVKSDSLCWGEMAFDRLPTNLQRPTSQKTVRFGDKVYCLSTDGSDFNMSVSDNPYSGEWNVETVAFPSSSVEVRSLTASNAGLYVLGSAGELLESSDGITWSDTGCRWATIIAGYEDRVLGLTLSDGKYCHASYPFAGNDSGVEVPTGFPVSGNSVAIELDSKWANSRQILTMGGRDSSGNLSGAAWAYDGSLWVKLSSGLPAAEGYAVVPYTISETDTLTWRVAESQVLLAFGGKKATEINRTVYLSRDYGVTWVKADEFLQLPDAMPSVHSADVVVFNTLIDQSQPAAVGSKWKSIRLAELPVWFRGLGQNPASRSSERVSTWECPYLYMFGGIDSNGNFQPTVWRGVVNHLSFRPLQ